MTAAMWFAVLRPFLLLLVWGFARGCVYAWKQRNG